MDVTVRLATLDDAAGMRDYAEALFAERPPGIFDRPAPTLADEVVYVRSVIDSPNSALFVAERDGRIIGSLCVTGETHPQEAHVGTIAVSVARDARGAGVGHALFDALFAWAPEHGITRLQLYAWATNPRAAALYRQLGFVDEGMLRSAVRLDGDLIDVHLLAKLL